MTTVLDIVLQSGRSVVELSLFTLLPIMTLMMAIMRLLDDRGVLRAIAVVLAGPFVLIGLPGIASLAMLQLTFVSYAAPLATLRLIDSDTRIDRRHLAATFAMIMAMSQANAVFPMAAVGLNVGFTIATSVGAGLVAAALCYYVFARGYGDAADAPGEELSEQAHERRPAFASLSAGGEEGMVMAFKAVPLLLIALVFVNSLRALGLIEWLGVVLGPVLTRVGIPGVAVVPIVTKYIAGGTAMMGIAMDLIREGAMTAVELNRIAGFIINPFDVIGVALYGNIGARTGQVVRPAVAAAAVAMVLRGVVHLIVFA